MVFIVKEILVASLFIVSVTSSKILLIFSIATPSHDILGRSYVRELLKRGHEVTYMSPYLLPNEDQSYNLTFFHTGYSVKPLSGLANVSETLLKGNKMIDNLDKIAPHMQQSSYRVLENEKMEEFLSNPANEFDLVVTEWLFNEVLAGVSAIFQCPLVWASSIDTHSIVNRLVDDVINPSYHPDSFIDEDVPPYSFVQRVRSLLTFLDNLYYIWINQRNDEKKYNEYFTKIAHKRGISIPSYEEVLYNGSLMLLNAHPSFSSAIRLPQNVKAIGGYHIQESTKPLPEDLKKIMDNSEHGVIYFSLGSVMRSASIPEDFKTGLLNSFSELKQTVLWKLEEDLPNKPPNVHIRKWTPQQEILRHHNTKLFITHGGLLSTTEAVYSGVPIIGIPIYGDQYLNIRRAESKGYAKTVKFSQNLVNELKEAIDEMLNNPGYAERARSLSELYHLRPQPPGEELAYWIEYVIKTKGAPHLRSQALMLPWYQRFYVDLLVVILLSFVVVFIVVQVTCRYCTKNIKLKTQ